MVFGGFLLVILHSSMPMGEMHVYRRFSRRNICLDTTLTTEFDFLNSRKRHFFIYKSRGLYPRKYGTGILLSASHTCTCDKTGIYNTHLLVLINAPLLVKSVTCNLDRWTQRVRPVDLYHCLISIPEWFRNMYQHGNDQDSCWHRWDYLHYWARTA